MRLTTAQKQCLETAAVVEVYRYKQNDGKQKGIWSVENTDRRPFPSISNFRPEPPKKLVALGLVELADATIDDPYARVYGGQRAFHTEVLRLTDKGEAYLAGALLA